MSTVRKKLQRELPVEQSPARAPPQVSLDAPGDRAGAGQAQPVFQQMIGEQV